MEELFVYAVLYLVGYGNYDEYQEALDRLFINAPQNNELLHLEEMKCKDAMLHLFHLMQSSSFDQNAFGMFLMHSLKSIYAESNIYVFAPRMYKLWNYLPSPMDETEPFHTFCYADDCLSYGDERQCRTLYENALNYYDE
ncbi:MAG: hypothetical protein Q4A05_00820 [Ruminococcus sp.]|nr:hypothetical protein [Ruminococcus sp.]